MELKISEIAARIRDLRDIFGITAEQMALATDTTPEEYAQLESGTVDFSFTFLYKCAEMFNVDMIELLTGENPHLSGYTLVRAGKGLPIKRRASFEYYHLAANFKDKLAEPFWVKVPYSETDLTAPIHTTTHEGQEFDYILGGRMKFIHDGHTEVLNVGDCVMYDSGKEHGMIALDGADCTFLAIVIKEEDK